ncbi:MAG: hydantoinase/oxoprolinase family protein [Solirubrobacterales bacterium]
MLLGVDVGGTFTDAVLFDGRTLHTAKAPTTPADEASGVATAIEAALASAGAQPGDVSAFAHGMTVGTNALLTESGARTALVATEGFTDLLDIARQDRPHLYRLCAARPRPLVPGPLRFEAGERVSAAGVVRELEDDEIERVVDAVRGSGAEAVAICLLFAHSDPGHERALATALREGMEGLHVSASHEVLPRFREYERCSTTVIDAYLSPLLGDYLRRLEGACRERGLPTPSVMKSSGGVAPIAEAAASGGQTVLSGPAGGAVGASLVARLSGDGNAVGLDMGGTSCDVCVISGGEVRRTEAREIAGRVIQLPMVDVHTVGAGGGSVAWRDPGGALRVGPRSAGAQPGPACYGRRGSEPTVTDANLLLGYLPRDSQLAGGVALDPAAAERAVGGLAAALGLGEIEAAEGIVQVANQEMVRALRVCTVERGVDPREFALMPFGGAGPLHAAAIATELGMRRLLCPRAGGVLSALGLLSSERRRDTARTVMLRAGALTAARIAEEVAELRASIGEGMEEAEAEAVYELRYRGQAFELPVGGSLAPDPAELAEAFAAEHEARYGYRDADAEVELVSIRLALVEAGPEVVPRAATTGLSEHSRRARFDGAWEECRVLRGEPEAGLEARGPCIFELPEATLVLPGGWRATVDHHGTILAEAEEDGAP